MLEVIEPDGMSTIQISNTGGTSILKSGRFQPVLSGFSGSVTDNGYF